MRSTQKEHEEIMPHVSGDFPFIHAPPCIHEEQASEDSRHTREHLKNVGHGTSGLETIGRRCQGSQGRLSRRRTSRWNHFIQRISRSEAAGFYFWRRASKP